MLDFFYRIGGPNPTLAVDASSYFPLGLAHVHVWNRKFEAADKHTRNYKYQPLEEKESFRWVDSARKSRATLHQAEHITFIADREADMYGLWQETNEQVDWLLRARDDRCLYQREEKLFEVLATTAVNGEIQLAIQHHGERADRLAELEVHYCRVKVARPKREKFSQVAYQQVYAVEVKEKASSVPPGEESIHWRLLTTHQISTLADALQVIEWYSLRWQIEQLFRTLKQQGLQIHRSQLSTGKALKKLTLMALPVALSCMQLVQDRTGRVGEKASIIFTQAQISFMHALVKSLVGKTEKLRNPHAPESLAWAAWIIARLGGWKGYSSQALPGVITMKRGLHDFTLHFNGWVVAKGRSP